MTLFRFSMMSMIILLSLVTACKKDPTTPVVQETTRIQLQAPTTAMLADRDSMYIYYARVVSGGPLDSIQCVIMNPGGTEHSRFALYDDGNSNTVLSPNYASFRSGDVVPLDGIFTRSLNGRLLAAGVTGNYTFIFNPMGVSDAESQTLHVLIENVDSCRITAYPSVNTFAECFDPIQMEVRVTPSTVDEIDSVVVKLLAGSEVLNQEKFSPSSGDSVWRLNFNPTFFHSIETGQNAYVLSYEANTRFGMVCQQQVNVLSFSNQIPTLTNSTLPDTFYRPLLPSDTDTVIFSVQLNDCELFGDTANIVFFNISKNNATDWGPTIFAALDNGRTPDVTAGNGIFTAGLKVAHSDTLLDNLWFFRFFAVESAPPFQQSYFLLDSMRIIQSGASTLLYTSPVSGWGFSVIP